MFILLAADITASLYLFNTTVVREHASAGRAQNFTGVNWNVYSNTRNELETLLNETKSNEYQIESCDGLSLYAQYFKSPFPNTDDSIKRIAICFHGYTGKGGSNSSAGSMYFLNKGFDVLMPDARAHGESEGDYIGFGCLDRYDGLKWIEFIQNMYDAEDKENRLEIYLYGVSMGGATVCMMSGQELPNCVKGIISDCAFTSPEKIFQDILRYDYHVPPAPIISTADIFCRFTAGYSFSECNAADEVKKSTVPILFIHGSADSFIPVEMCYELYNNCASKKDILIIEGAAHTESYYMNREMYENKITEFFNL